MGDRYLTLMVYAYSRDAGGRMTDLPISFSEWEPTLAGFESTRTSFYGSKETKALGLRILPLLAKESMLYIEGEELNELKNEVEILLRNLTASDDYWYFRLKNILLAIETAKAHNGNAGVAIG